MASVTPHISNLPLEDTPAARQQQTMSTLEAKVESVIGIGTLNVASQGISNDSLEEEHAPLEKQIQNQAGLGVADRSTMVGLALPNSSGSGSPQKMGPSFQGQGQHFEPLDKSVSQTVKVCCLLYLLAHNIICLFYVFICLKSYLSLPQN